MFGRMHPRKGDDVAELFLDLGAAAIGVAKKLPRDDVGRHVARQLMRAATSGGANYEEARGAESRKDFVHKLRLADKEIRETRYWARLVLRVSPQLVDTARPVERLTWRLNGILTTSIRTASRNLPPPQL
jgi:four helix bundle protein